MSGSVTICDVLSKRTYVLSIRSRHLGILTCGQPLFCKSFPRD